MKKLYLLLNLCFLATTLFSQNNNPWKTVEETAFAKSDMDRRIVPDRYETFSLDLAQLDNILKKAPMRFSEKAKEETPVLAIPIPDGRFMDFNFVEAPVMHPELAAKYPEIKTFAGWSKDDPTAYMRFGISPKGFHGMILSAKHSTVFIDVYAEGETGHYLSYFKKDYHRDDPFTCHFDELSENQIPNTSIPQYPNTKAAGDCQFREYALALACTGEYANYHGGTKASVMAEFNVAMARVNGIYERDFTLTMIMVPNNDELIFLNASTDPYTNNIVGQMLGQNQTTCDNIIGLSNYDIGHVFSTGGGGIASLNSTCGNGRARGVTGLPNPVNDPFYVDYVSHEMGHQFGGRHTFNSNQGSCSGNQSGIASVEPGSGTTIQAYAGICGSHNVQNNSDDYFHAYSLTEMSNHISGNGGNCAVLMPNGNNAPSVTVASNTYNVPVSTPFVLTGIGTDPDTSNMLTYCWEQMDPETVTMPPSPNNTAGPSFRSLSPVVSPSRYFPNLNAIVNNQNPTWEVLPGVSRDMNFRCTVRDNNPGGGCTAETDVTLNFSANAGPFLVITPNTSTVEWTSTTTETVTWNVANTDDAPVNASTVDIFLSLDGGFTYSDTLLLGTPNDGSAMVTVPNVESDQARVMVKGSDNIFFDISNENFIIELPDVPTFAISANPSTQQACPEGEVQYQFDLLSFVGFDENINFSAIGIPAGVTVDFQPTSLVPPGVVTMVVDGLENVMPGTYTIDVTAQAMSITHVVAVELVVLEEVSGAVTLTTPSDGTSMIGPNGVVLDWDTLTAATNFILEVSESPDFQTLVFSENVAESRFELPDLPIGQVYYWRVKGINICSEGSFSPFYAFQSGGRSCNIYNSTDVPKSIPPSGGGLTISEINISDDFLVTSVYLHFDLSHSWVGDISGQLNSPDGTPSFLFNRPGSPATQFGCGGNDMSVGFSDEAPNTSTDLENMCNGTAPAIEGDFQPITPISDFTGKTGMGTWSLRIDDLFPQFDSGILQAWYLELCQEIDYPEATLLNNNVLSVPQGMSRNITQSFLETQGIPEQTTYIILSPPENGILNLQGIQLGVGGSFKQMDINNGLLSYTHDGSMTTTDDFVFDVENDTSEWLHNQLFQIEILENTLAVTVELTQGIACHDGNNAVITVTATGGTDPLAYSLNGGSPQSSNVFDGLGEGDYEVTVSDANGFSFTTSPLSVTSPSAITVSADVVDDDVTVTASGGTGDLEYSIDGTNFQSSDVFNDLDNDTYTITVRDENGCTETVDAIVAVNTMVVSASQTQAISCFGEDDGEITVNVGGGTPDFMYSLDGVNFQSSNIFEDLSAGTYTVTVEDADGFEQTDMIDLAEPSVLISSASVVGYEVTVTASGGTGDFQYGLDGGLSQSDNVFYPVPSGSHDIVVEDENGCETTISVDVNVPAITAELSISQTPSCSDSSNGSLVAQGQGGVPPYQYSLNGGPFQSSNVFPDLPAGNYTVTVMDSGGFSVSSSMQVLSGPPPIVISPNVNVNEVTVIASGGTEPYLYKLDNDPFQGSNVFTNVSNGMHTITVQDENGCEMTTTVTVSLPPLQVVANVVQGISCHDVADGIISINASGGIPPYEYSLDGINFQSDNTFIGLASGDYQPTVLDAAGQVLVSPQVTLLNPDPIMANGSAFGPVITVDAMGGTGDLAYSFDDMPFQNENEYEVISNGTYDVVVMDENGCTVELEVTVNKPEELIVSVIPPTCADSEDGAIIIDGVNGGVSPFQFAFNNGSFSSNTAYTGLGDGQYVFIIMDDTGYEWTAPPIVLNAPPPIEVTTDVVADDLTINASGGTGSFQYSIDSGMGFQNENVFLDLPNDTYDVVVMDENGCTLTTNVVINVNTTNEVNGGLLFEVTPNPSSGIFNITMQVPLLGELQMEVYNAIGQKVFQSKSLSGGFSNETVDLSFLANGHYQFKVTSGELWGVKRLVVVR